MIPEIEITTIMGSTPINKEVVIPAFKEFRTQEKLHFYLFKFHNKFNGLIGVNLIIQLGIKIDLLNKKLVFPNHQIPLNFTINGNKTIQNINFDKCSSLQKPIMQEKSHATLRVKHLSPDQRSKITQLCNKYSEIFQLKHTKLTTTPEIAHHIELTSEKPIFKRQYRYPNAQKTEIQKQIKELLENDIIRESKSPWNSPIIIVNKKQDASGEQKFRMVIDYRELNDKTVNDRYPVPHIEGILDQLNGSKFFSILDLKSGFHQIPMYEKDIEKTAFSVENNHYEYVRMPFGLKNAPSTFLRLMNRVLSGLIGTSCLCYMDDIIIYGKTIDEHFQNIELVFKRLQSFNLKVQLDKSEFIHTEIPFLGHIVSDKGIRPNPEKIIAITNMKIPSTTKQLKSFLGIIGYYRKFIHNFAEKTKPLTKKLKKDAKINIKEQDYVTAFQQCKDMLCKEPILTYPDFLEPFELTTDASNYAIGAILSQNDKPISYASRTLNSAETNYSATEKELLAIVWATKHYRPYLYGKTFQIYTDHKPLEWLFKLKDPNSKLTRWRLRLEEFDYKVVYKKGKENSNVDALSRIEINIHNTESNKESVNEHKIPILQKEAIPITKTPLNEFKRQIFLLPDPSITKLRTKIQIYHESRQRITIKTNVFNEQKLIFIIKKYVNPDNLTAILCNPQTAKLLNIIVERDFKYILFLGYQ